MFEIFQYDFMQRALIAGLIIGVTAPLTGIFLVVRRSALVADTLAHVSLFGVALGVILNVNPMYTATGTAIITSFFMEKLKKEKRLMSDSILSLFLSVSLAFTLVLFSISGGNNVNITNYLFGSIMTISTQEVYTMLLLGIIIIGTVYFLYKDFFLLSFDTQLAMVKKIPVALVSTIFALIVALQVSFSLRAVGVLLIGALMIIPVISAFQFGIGFKKSLFLSILFSLLSVLLGLYTSYYFGIATSGSIVVISFVFFIICFLINKIKCHQ